MGYPIQLTDDSLPAILPCHTYRLLGGGKLLLVTENIDSWKLEAPIASHRFPQGKGLGEQGSLREEMTGQCDFMLLAPISYGV